MTTPESDSGEWIVASGRMFAFFPVRCFDGRWAWLRVVGWADVQQGLFYSPYTVRRIYSITRATDAATS